MEDQIDDRIDDSSHGFIFPEDDITQFQNASYQPINQNQLRKSKSGFNYYY